MIRLAWFVAGAIVSALLNRRDDLEDRLGELEAEADARRADVPDLCGDCHRRLWEARAAGKAGIVTCGRPGCNGAGGVTPGAAEAHTGPHVETPGFTDAGH